jgi:ribosomal protein S18 acetylase RimI-like enzyme
MSRIIELSEAHASSAAGLWEHTGLVRPWNDPVGDFRRAIEGETSAVLGVVDDAVGEAAGNLAGGDRVIGTAMVGVDGHRGWVYYVAVAPDAQQQGLGSELMQAAEAWLRANNAPKVQLMVRTTNAAVVAFYERLGYSDQSTAVLGKFLDPELEELKRRLS